MNMVMVLSCSPLVKIVQVISIVCCLRSHKQIMVVQNLKKSLLFSRQYT